MAKITENTRNEVKEIVLDFFAEECEIDKDEITEDSNIVADLDGDSLMFLELIEIFKKKYNLNIELKTIGKFAVKNPVKTIGELIDMQMLIIEHENNILNIE
ncbi:MAG: acyl carrier protein [Thiohalospira sp.]